MPFLSVRDSREVNQGLTQASFVEEASFGETFAAGVGQVFDEELSVSSMLNMQGFNQRKEQVKELGNSGGFNISEYTSAVGDVNYEKISKDFPDLKIKNDKTLFDERATLLKERREYAQDVFDRGNGMAQFLGMATAYMLDPINIATMPIATAGTAVKGLGALGRAITVGRNEAGLAVAAELMIQPLVYQHKHDINSPFEFKDALLNIVTAATGAAVIGGTVGGISGHLKNVREKTAGLPLDDDAKMSLSALARVEDDLNLNRATIIDDVVTSKFNPEVIPSKTGFDIKTKNGKLQGSIEDDAFVVGTSKVSKEMRGKGEGVELYVNAIKEAKERGLKRFVSDETVDAPAIRVYEALEKRGFPVVKHPDFKIVKDPKGDFAHAGDNPPYSIDVNSSPVKSTMDVDVDYLVKSNNKMVESNQPSKVKENYIQPERKAATTGSVTQRERAVVERNGLTKDYDADIEAFKALDNPRIVQDDQMVDASAFMKSIDDEINGIDEVLRCAIV